MRDLDRQSSVISTPCGAVQFARRGTGFPVLVSHGGPGGFDQGLAWAWHLASGGCEVIAVSRPGYLRTPLRSGTTPDRQADLFAALLDGLGIDIVGILGFSSGGPAAVHFAARHPGRTAALFLDTAILLPYELSIGRLRRATFETGLFTWLSHQMVTRRPALMTRFAVEGVSDGLDRSQMSEAVRWITSDPARLGSIREQFVSVAPRRYRRVGWANDLDNERDLEPLPFEDVIAPTVIAHGFNDAIVPQAHATSAAERIDRSELLLVEEGHHLLSLSRNYGQVARRQLELIAVRGTPGDQRKPEGSGSQ